MISYLFKEDSVFLPKMVPFAVGRAWLVGIFRRFHRQFRLFKTDAYNIP